MTTILGFLDAKYSFILAQMLLGVSLAAPIGPVNVEMIQQGLTRGFWAAFRVRLGAGMANTVCLVVAFWGLSPWVQNPVVFVACTSMGAGTLVWMGWRATRPLWGRWRPYRATLAAAASSGLKPGTTLTQDGLPTVLLQEAFEEGDREEGSSSLAETGFSNPTKGMGLGFILGLTSPVGLMFWLGASATGLAQGNFFEHLWIIAGILGWGALFSMLLAQGRRWCTPQVVQGISVMSGFFLLFFGLKYACQAAERLWSLAGVPLS